MMQGDFAVFMYDVEQVLSNTRKYYAESAYSRKGLFDKRAKNAKNIQSVYFNERYGRSDFKELDPRFLGESIKYLLKYIEKTGEHGKPARAARFLRMGTGFLFAERWGFLVRWVGCEACAWLGEH